MRWIIHSRRHLLLSVLLAVAASLSIAPATWAETIHVPRDHKTIQAAIDAANAGDVVLVSAGTYRERISLKPGITVRSEGGEEQGALGLKRAEATIINGKIEGATKPGVEMAEDSTLDGFSVTGVGEYDHER